MSLTPCSSCGRHVLDPEADCPHCGSGVLVLPRSASALLLGLTLSGCVTIEDLYGVTTTDFSDKPPTETSDTGTTETGTSDTGTTETSDTGP